MSDRNLQAAQDATAAGRTDDWVNAFLSSGLGANPPMATGLRKQQRWWIGPVLVPIASLTRIGGPEPEMEYQESPEEWDVRVAAIMNLDPAQLPPLILEYRGAGLPLALHDGSHRHEALRRRGHASTWAFIWCNSEADFKIAQMTVPVPTGDAR